MARGNDGAFYGTTSTGGQGGNGTVFRFTAGPAPVFQPVGQPKNGSLVVTWSTVTGGSYQLQSSSSLSSNAWANLGSVLTASGSTLSATNPIASGSPRFYRVVLLP